MASTTSSKQNQLKVGRTSSGYALRVEGRGTMRESPTALEFATEVLEAAPTGPDAPPPLELVVDLTDCDYLDSTFLGCLLTMQRRFGNGRLAPTAAANLAPGRQLSIAVPPEKRTRLFGSSNLQSVLRLVEATATIVEGWRPLVPEPLNARDHARHVMESHRLLAELGGPHAPKFAAIAEQLQRELESAPPQSRTSVQSSSAQ